MTPREKVLFPGALRDGLFTEIMITIPNQIILRTAVKATGHQELDGEISRVIGDKAIMMIFAVEQDGLAVLTVDGRWLKIAAVGV